jgi:ankyrin repeat protein
MDEVKYACESDRQTAIHMAIRNQNCSVLKYLLDEVDLKKMLNLECAVDRPMFITTSRQGKLSQLKMLAKRYRAFENICPLSEAFLT